MDRPPTWMFIIAACLLAVCLSGCTTMGGKLSTNGKVVRMTWATN